MYQVCCNPVFVLQNSGGQITVFAENCATNRMPPANSRSKLVIVLVGLEIRPMYLKYVFVDGAIRELDFVNSPVTLLLFNQETRCHHTLLMKCHGSLQSLV